MYCQSVAFKIKFQWPEQWPLRLMVEILADLQLTVNFSPFRLREKKVHITIFHDYLIKFVKFYT